MQGEMHARQRRKRVCLPRRGVPLPPETRAKITASLTLRPPAEHVEAILAAYRTMGLRRVAEHVGYDKHVVRRVLREAGVPIRAPGRHAETHGASHG